MAGRGDARAERTEKQVVALLTLPLSTYDPVTVLGLSTYPAVMSLLKPSTCKARGPCSLPHAERALQGHLPHPGRACNGKPVLPPEMKPTCAHLSGQPGRQGGSGPASRVPARPPCAVVCTLEAATTKTASCSVTPGPVQGMAVKIVETVLRVGTEVGEPEQVDMLFDFIAPLVSDAEPYEGDDEVRQGCLICTRQPGHWGIACLPASSVAPNASNLPLSEMPLAPKPQQAWICGTCSLGVLLCSRTCARREQSLGVRAHAGL